MASQTPTIAEWFRDRNVFITGGTGFMGKVMVHKLLLSCPDLGNIFLLVRKKKDVDPHTRWNVMSQQEPFKNLRQKYPERLKKIVLVPGDTLVEDLALSASDKRRLLQEVSVVFHMAANVKFDMRLKDAIKINTNGTMNILSLAKQMPHLESFIHVSTAYCQCEMDVLEERAYETVLEPESVVATVNQMTDDILDVMTPKLLKNQPNTYAFSKALSEDLVQRCGLPAGVIRPSIVTASWKEPVPGWVENMNGPTGLMIGAGKGVIRTFLCHYDQTIDIIPCDIAINATIALAWKVGLEKPVKPIYMNAVNCTENPISWGFAIDTGRKYTVSYPYTGVLWYPGGSITSSKLYHWLRVILFHFLPAYILDTFIFLTGNKPFLVRIQHKVNAGIELVQYYTMKEWVFLNDRMKSLQNELCPADKEEFYMDSRAISWNDYLLQYILGARQYCLKDDNSTLPRARKVMSYLYYADWILKIILFFLLAWFVYSCLMSYREVTTTVFEGNEI